jgi:hypothetical protein
MIMPWISISVIQNKVEPRFYGIDDTKVTRSGKDPKYELYRLYSVDLQKKVITEYTKKKDGSIN